MEFMLIQNLLATTWLFPLASVLLTETETETVDMKYPFCSKRKFKQRSALIRLCSSQQIIPAVGIKIAYLILHFLEHLQYPQFLTQYLL